VAEAGNRALGVQEVPVLDGEAQKRFKVLQFFVGAILGRSFFEKVSL